MSQSNWTYLDVEEVVKETERAILCRLEDGEEVWVPITQIDDGALYQQGDTNCTIAVSNWWAKQQGFEVED